MPKKNKYSLEERIKICEDYLNGTRSPSEIAADLGIKKLSGTIRTWIRMYQTYGADALIPSNGYNSYSADFKKSVIDEYYINNSSLEDLSAKYKINLHTIHKWLSRYNNDISFKDNHYRPEVYMSEARRKTTEEERLKIVEICISNDYNYASTAQKFDVSYSQVYSWVKKYESNGKAGLIDKRGHHKTDDEVNELERLRRENLRLKKQLKERDMAVELLKKVKEFERM